MGGECSYWACIPSKVLLRPLEVVARARLAPGAAEAVGAVDPARVFWWRDQVSEKDDASQAEWLAKQGAELVRGTGVVAEPGLVTVGERELAYDALLVATGSVPVDAADRGPDGGPVLGQPRGDERERRAREPRGRRRRPGRLRAGAGLLPARRPRHARPGRRATPARGWTPRRRRSWPSAFAEEGIELRFDARATRVEGGGAGPFRLELEGQDPVVAEKLLVATGRKPNVEGFGLERLGLTIEKGGIARRRRPRRGRRRLGRRGRDRHLALHPRRQVPGPNRRAERRRGRRRRPTTAPSRPPSSPTRRSPPPGTRAAMERSPRPGGSSRCRARRRSSGRSSPGS